MDGRHGDGVVLVGGDARQRFHQARGYGRPREDGELALAPVEAAHLLFRGDLSTVDGADFKSFVSDQEGDFIPRFLVYTDLRNRGFYLSPARPQWVDSPSGLDFVVYPRGAGPGDDEIAYRVRVVEERDVVDVNTMDNGVLAVVDEESEITYLEGGTDLPTGTGTAELPGVIGRLLGDRVLIWDPDCSLHQDAFFGQPLSRDEGPPVLQLSLVEAAYLAAEGVLTVDASSTVEAVLTRGRTAEGDRFDRRLKVYRSLRSRGLIPKTGFKFGADFRVYTQFDSPDTLGHSGFLIRVAPTTYSADPRSLALDVRLAHGVRKTMVYGLVSEGEVLWRTLRRLTP